MDPISFAILAFSTLAGGLISYGIDKYKTGLQQENEDKQLKLSEDNLALNKKVSEQNFDLSVDQFEYQKQLNDTLMQREDTAYQRQVSDLKAAGLSPLMVSGGASASPLTSAPAPQKDLSGFNTALSNMLGAYNDVYNRRLNRQQFSMQNRLQKAQFTANLLDTANQIKKSKIEQSILDLDYKYYKNHPERNLGLQSVIINALERMISKNPSALNTSFPNIQLPGTGSGNGLFDLGTGSRSIVANPSVTPAQIVKDQKKIINSEKSDYQHAIDILGNFSNSDFQQDSLRYIYRHTNAWREYETLEDFRNALLKAKNKQKFLADFPYIERKDFKLGS